MSRFKYYFSPNWIPIEAIKGNTGFTGFTTQSSRGILLARKTDVYVIEYSDVRKEYRLNTNQIVSDSYSSDPKYIEALQKVCNYNKNLGSNAAKVPTGTMEQGSIK